MKPGRGDLHGLATPGAVLSVRVTPRAGRNAVAVDAGGLIRVHVTEVPENGRATQAAQRLLAEALGLAPSRLTLLAGAASRDKRFRVEG